MSELRWIPSARASALHAACALLEGRSLTDPALAAALAEPVANLRGVLRTDLWPADSCFSLLMRAAASSSDVSVAPGTLPILDCNHADAPLRIEPDSSDCHDCCAQLWNAFDRAAPRAAQELELRIEPLRGQWEARGPGLLRIIGKLIEPGRLMAKADVVLLYPVLGGGGRLIQFSPSAVAIEAVLANPIPELPEVVRLGWLLAQRGFAERPAPASLPQERLAKAGSLALLPAVLAAAEEVELVRSADTLLARTIDLWRLGPVDPAVIVAWWHCYQTRKPDWGSALAELDRALR